MTNLEGGLFERSARRIEELTPESGYSVVGVDTFEAIGDELYFASHHATHADAEAAATAMARSHPMDHFHVYYASGKP